MTMAITSCEHRTDAGRRFRFIDWEGKRVRVYDDALTVLKLIDLFEDEEADIAVKGEVCARLLFVDPQGVIDSIKDVSGLLAKAIHAVGHFEMRDDTQKKVLDWEQDAGYIKASTWATYAQEFNEIARTVSYAELCDLVALCPHETPIGQALYYRTAKEPKATKHNKQEREDFRRKRKFWALKPKGETTKANHMEQMNSAATAAARALARTSKAASHG